MKLSSRGSCKQLCARVTSGHSRLYLLRLDTTCRMVVLLLATAALALLVALVLRMRGGLWARLGVPYEKGLPIVGSTGRLLTQTASISQVYTDIYQRHKGKPFVGYYEAGGKPSLLIRDPELAKKILTSDFSSFHDNAFQVNPKLDPILALNPFLARGDKWKQLRTQLTPAFSSGRLRNLHALVAEIAQEMVAYVRAEGPASLPDGLDVKELAAKFTTEVVSKAAFGVQANSFRDDNAEIRNMGRRILQLDPWNTFLFTINLFFPMLGDILRIKFLKTEVDSFFRGLVNEVVKHREDSGVTKNDFLQLLIGLKQKAQAQGDNSYGLEEITAHAMSFFTDGFETSSIALSFLLHDLSGSATAQRRLREELLKIPVDDHEAVLNLPFLQACLMESLRIHAPAGFSQKLCTRSYLLNLPDGGEAVLPKGTQVVLPIFAWHTDPDLFPDPQAFRPERFLEEEGARKLGFMPFGDGPRQCIGMRFAVMQIKLAVAAIVRSFDLRRTARSPADPVVLDPKGFLTSALGGLWLQFEPLPTAA